MIIWLLAIGLISMLGQVVLLRELNVAFFGSELIYILALGVWLLWTATGAAIGRRAHLPTGRQVRLLLLAHGCLLPLAVVLVRGLRPLFGGVPGAYLPFPRQLLAMTLSLLPVGLTLGLLFQWAAKLYVGGRRSLAGAYAIESAGGLVGGLLATLFLIIGVQNLTAAMWCALLSVAASCHPWRRREIPYPAVVAALLLFAMPWSGRLDAGLTSWNHPDLLATADTPYSRVTVTRAAGQISVFENDALSFESEGTAAEEFAHLAAIQHPSPGSMLVLGGGIEGLVMELLVHRPERIDYVELNGRLLDLLIPHLPEGIRHSLEDEAVAITVADPRNFLDREVSFDLMLIGMPEPDSGQANRFYTREFFSRCAERLAAGGVLALRLRGAENLWTPQQTRRAASIHHALDEVFADVVVLPGVTNIILASDGPLARDPAPLAGRLTERGVSADLVIPAYVHYLYTNDRFFEIAELLAGAGAPVNSDTRPICYQYTLLIWLSKFFPVVAILDWPDVGIAELVGSPPGLLGAAVLVVVLLLFRRQPLLRRSLLAAFAGFAGMILETAVILNYQIQRGILFQDLGILLTAFMAGLALGAAALDWLARRGEKLVRAAGVALLAALAVSGLALAALLRSGAVANLLSSIAALLVCGSLVAALFAYVSLHRRPDQRAVVSPLYASDLVGGCVGSLVASLFLIPALGMPASALLTACLVLFAFLLV
jgi:spermidine synthase